MKAQRYLFFFLSLLCLFFSSCKKQIDVIDTQQMDAQKKAHKWYAFCDTGLLQVDLPQQAPPATQKEWTESSFVFCAFSLPDFQSISCCLLVNRLGFVVFEDDMPKLLQDYALFSFDTCSSSFSLGKDIFWTSYKDRTFNKLQENNIMKTRPFLSRLDTQTKLLSPLMTYSDLGLEDTCEVTQVFLSNNSLLLCTKDYGKEKNVFSYYELSFSVPLDIATSFDVKDKVKMTKIQESAFQEKNTPLPFDFAPQEVKDVFSSLPQSFDFEVTAKTLQNNYDTTYWKGKKEIENKAFCTVAPSGTVAVFLDGTTFLKRNEKPLVALRLPLLPSGFVYGPVAIFNDTMVISWEEKDFFFTKKAGFLTVDLNLLGL